MILKFKHVDSLHLNPLFAHFLIAPFTALAEANHLIVPTPLHAKRYLHRRFSQSAELAAQLCQKKQAGIFAPEALTRQKAGSTPRTATAQPSGRVYRATRPASPHRQAARAGDDDVMTTGATLYEAAKTLHRVGSDPFRGPVLARVLRHGL